MKLILMGTPSFALPVLSLLHEEQKGLGLVISQPDRRSGRRKARIPPPIKITASHLGVEVFQPENVNSEESLHTIREYGPDLMVTAAYGQKLGRSLLKIPRCGCVNLHPSLLPKYRGAAPVPHALLKGEKETGISIFRMVSKMDAGPILAQERMELDDTWTSGRLERHLAERGAELLLSILDRLDKEDIEGLVQDEEQVTFAPKLTKEMGFVDWTQSATDCDRRIRAMDPWPGGYSWLKHGGKSTRLILLQVRVSEGMGAEPGTVIRVNETTFTIQCGQDALDVLKVKPESKRAMFVGDFIRGGKIATGDRFGSSG